MLSNFFTMIDRSEEMRPCMSTQLPKNILRVWIDQEFKKE
jgi:hypothetical protein